MPEFYKWFRIKGTDMRWLSHSPANRLSRCDHAYQHLVQPQEPRLQVDSGAGPARKRGKGKRHEYLCVGCALSLWGQQPPQREIPGQEKMFDDD